MKLSASISFSLLAAVALVPTARAQSITSLGTLPGNGYSDCIAVSKNGNVVAGNSAGVNGNRAVRRTNSGPLQDLGALPTATDSWVFGMSADGKAIVGLSQLPDREAAFRWTQNAGMIDLGMLPGGTVGASAYGASNNGAAVVGTSDSANGFRAYRWTMNGGMADLGVLQGGTYSFGLAVSANGHVVTGFADLTGGAEHAFRWTAQHGMQDLGAVNPDEPSSGYAISANGNVIAGYSGPDAARWVHGTPQSLGHLDGGSFSAAYGVNEIGHFIVGLSDDETHDLRAILWTPLLGMVDLNELLPTLGVDLTGWTLEAATSISANGRRIVGVGLVNGARRGFIATLPNPGSCGEGWLPNCGGEHGHH